MRCKMLLFNAAISSFSAATTKSGNLKYFEILGCLLKRATQLHQRWLPLRLVVRESSESSEDVRSTQASSDKDSSSPLLIKTVFAVISEDMIR